MPIPLLGVIASLLVGVLLTQLVTVLRRRIHSRAQQPLPTLSPARQ